MMQLDGTSALCLMPCLTKHNLLRTLAFLAVILDMRITEGLKLHSIKSYLSGIHYLQIQHRLGNPFASPLPRLEYVLTGIKWVEARGGSRSRTRLIEILERLRGIWLAQPIRTDEIMLWTAACTVFSGFLRAGEFTVPSADAYDPASYLSLSDVALDCHTNPSMVRLVLQQSKTDPFRQGMEIFMGQSGTELCPPVIYRYPSCYSGTPLHALHRAAPYQGIPGLQLTGSSQADRHGRHNV